MRQTRITFSRKELKDLFLAWFVISLAFTLFLVDGFSSFEAAGIAFLASCIASATGFIAHELAHKFVAIQHGCSAEFHANRSMLLVTLILSAFGFLLAAPGAVVTHGSKSARERGLVSAAGPAANIVMGAIFAVLLFITPAALSIIPLYGLLINGWLALFNLIPFPPFDGSKVFKWNKIVYGVMVVLSVVLVFGQYVIR